METYHPLPTWFEIFIIFIIKSNSICATNNSKLRNFVKKFEVASKRNTISWKIILSIKSKRFRERYRLHKSNLNTQKVWWTQGDIKYNPKNVSKWKKKIRIPCQFRMWSEGSLEAPLLIIFKTLYSKDYCSLNVQVNLSSGTHLCWSLPLTACNIAKSTDIC